MFLAVANYHIFPFGRKPICCQRKQYEEDTDMLYSSLEVLATSIVLLEVALFQGRWHPAQYTLMEKVEASVYVVQILEFWRSFFFFVPNLYYVLPSENTDPLRPKLPALCTALDTLGPLCKGSACSIKTFYLCKLS